MTCESCERQFLPYLYDLLDPQEHEELEAHLRECPHCQVELERAQGRRADIAVAVKSSFAQVVFATPRSPAKTASAAPPPRVPRRPLLLSRWAMAAAVLLAVLSVASVGAGCIYYYQSAAVARQRQALDDAQAVFEQVRKEVDAKQAHVDKDIDAIKEQIDRLFGDWDNQIEKTQQDPKQKRVYFELKGPRTVQAGGTNRYDVQVKAANPQHSPKIARLVAEVVNEATRKVVFTKTLDPGVGRNQLVLPPDMPVRPGDELALVLQADLDDGPAEVREQLTLAFPDYVTYLSTDRPMYRPGEVVHVRSLTLERFALRPAAEDLTLRYRIMASNNVEVLKTDVSTRLVAGKQKLAVEGPDGKPLHGIGTAEFTLPKQLPGGVYALSVSEANERFPEERRTFVVHRWQAPRFNKEVEFHRASYGPGENVIIRGKVTRLGQQGAMGMGGGAMAGGPGGAGFGMPGMGGPENIRIDASAVIDGAQVLGASRNAEPDGSFTFDFNVPANLNQGNGTVTLQFNDNAIVETVVRTVPIVLRDVFVDFYPEGGDLVAGVPNRVYFQARTGAYRPVAVRGRLMEKNRPGLPAKQAREVARIETFTDAQAPGMSQGLGVFTFEPQAGRQYEVRLDTPVGNARAYPLPAPKADGVVLRLPQGVVAKDIPVTVYSAQHARELLVGAYCRGKLLASAVVTASAGAKQDLVLQPAVDVGGVYRVTVFDKRQIKGTTIYAPVAERLLFRKQAAQLHVAIRPESSQPTPGESVWLNLAATNEKKEYVPSVVMCAVIDSSVVKLAGEKAERGMPTHFLLTSEIRRPADLENADALLNEANPRSAEALDLLLGTQGWRRFAEQDPQRFLQKQRNANGRPGAFLASAQPVTRGSVGGQKTLDNLDRKFVGDFVTLEEKLAQKEREHDSVPELQQLRVYQSTVNAAGQAVSVEQERLNDLWAFFGQAAFGAAVGLLVFFGFFLVATSLYRLAEGKSGYILLGAGLCLLGFLFVVSVLGTFALLGSPIDNGLFMRGRAPFFGMAATPKVPMPVPQGPAAWQQIPDDPRWQIEREEQMDAAAEQPNGPAGGGTMPGGPPIPLPPNGEFNGNDAAPQGFQDLERTLRQQGRFQELLQRKLNRKVNVPPPADPSVVREYAHRHKDDPSQVRRDFAETLYWQPALVLKDGQGKIRFDLSDAVTNFRVLAVSHTLDGRLGSDVVEFSSHLPYEIEPKVPIEIASSDQVQLPVAVSNHSPAATGFAINVLRNDGLRLLKVVKVPAPDPNKVPTIAPGRSARQWYYFQPTITSGTAKVRFQGVFGKHKDAVERSFAVVPDGFPVSGAISGTLEGKAAVTTNIVMPSNWIAGSLFVEAQAYPTILADLQSGLDALLREPHGCFEQASSSNYPNVLLLNYLQDTRQVNPAIENRARMLLARGYPQLVGYECIAPDNPQLRRGYEWFGQTAPPHEALTAYALLQFNDMARVYAVDKAMLERTRQYLLDQRDGKGGFKRNVRAVDQFGRAPVDITNAYIVWALTETGTREELAPELDALYQQAQQAKDPYFLALAGLAQLNAGRTEPGVELLRQLRSSQRVSGEVAGARTSITNSAGRDLLIETTALSALGWLRAGRPVEFQANAHKAGQWLFKQRSGAGGFGATQSTVLALKALIAFAAQNQKALQPTDLRVEVTHANGQNVSGEMRLTPGMIEPVTIRLKEKPGDEKQEIVLAPGNNEVAVRLTDGNNHLPFTLSWSYRTRKPVGSPLRPLDLTTSLDKQVATEGSTVKLHVAVENRSRQDQGMAVAVVGLPAGLALPDDLRQLKELTRLTDDGKPNKISAWEMHGSRELVLYWREFKADAKIEVDLDLVARLPGIYSGPASRAYLYYNSEHKHWVDPLHVTVNELP